jgi:cytoskeletal protein CcmA (bactofilin family)
MREGRAQMTDNGVETIAAPAVNGEREIHSAEQPVTVLAKEDSLSGRLQIRSSGSVLGTFSGRIECEGDLMIGSEAHVEADIHASRVTIAGYVRGNVTAPTRLKITSSGRLEGDARVGALVVQEGGVHHGVIRVHPEGIPEGADQAVIDSGPRPETVTVRSPGKPVDRVKKFWGEFF